MSNQKTRLIIVDVSNFIFRAFFAIRPMHAPDGTPTNAVYGIFTMLLKLISDHRPTHLFLARDTKGGSFRNELYREYKANRSEPPDDLIPQFKLIDELIEKMGLPTFSHNNFEADDIIGSAVTQWKNEFDEIYIASGDKDLMQFVHENVFLLDTMKDKLYKREDVFEKMGVYPEQIVDYLSIVGDTSDNIPGMKGIGAVGAAQLLKNYGNFDNIVSHIGELKGKKVIEAFTLHLEAGLLSKKLVQICTDVELGHHATETKFQFYPGIELETFLKNLGFKSILLKIQELRFQHHLMQESDKQISPYESVNDGNPELTDTPLFKQLEVVPFEKIEVTDDVASVDDFYKNLFDHHTLAINPVYTSKDILNREIRELYVGVANKVWKFSGQSAIDVFITLHAKRGLVIASSDTKRDLAFLRLHRRDVDAELFDVVVAHFNLAAQSRHDLSSISEEYLKKRLNEDSPIFDWEKTFLIFKLREILAFKMKEFRVDHVFRDIDMPLLNVLAKMELEGIVLNPNYLKELEGELEKEIKSIENNIFSISEMEINLNSPKQVGAMLFEKMGLPIIKKTKTGYSTDAEVLEELDGMNLNPVPGLLLTHREYGKILSTYVKALPELIHPETKRVHTNYNMTIAQTGRLSSTHPNLQNIPVRSEMGQKVRKAFIAKPGRLLLSADYSQVELRLLAHFSEDPTMLKSFNDDLDIHTQTASEVLGKPLSEITPNDRSMAKTVNFGLMYGQGSFGLAQTLKISRHDAKMYIEKYFARFNSVKTFLDHLKDKAEQTGFAETYHGRKRVIPEIQSQNRTIKAQGERMAINSPIQGTAADIIKLAMIAIDQKIVQKGLQSKMLLQVHDELIFEVVEEELSVMQELVKNEMENVVKLKIPLSVSMGYAVNWFEL